MTNATTIRRVIALGTFATTTFLTGCSGMTTTRDTSPSHAALAELAPSGKLRAAINFGNPILANKDAATREARGVSVYLARELGKRLGVPLELVT